jgi:hypothetical protein
VCEGEIGLSGAMGGTLSAAFLHFLLFHKALPMPE